MKLFSVFTFLNFALLCSSTSFAQNCGDLPVYSSDTAKAMYKASTDLDLDYKSKNANDDCYKRADEIHSMLKKKGVRSSQAFIQTENEGGCGATGASCMGENGPYLIVTSIYDKSIEYSWEFHTAPVICVEKDKAQPELYVIDPSTTLKPTAFKTWVELISYGLDSHEYSTYLRTFRADR